MTGHAQALTAGGGDVPEAHLLVDDEGDIREIAAISMQAVGGYRCATPAVAPRQSPRWPSRLLDAMMSARL